MKLVFTESAWADYLWVLERVRTLLKRLNSLIKESMRTPFEGTGNRNGLRAIFPVSGRGASPTSID
jgi:toxin YoeB